MSDEKRVMLSFPDQRERSRLVMRGVVAYASQKPGWSVELMPRYMGTSLKETVQLGYDGLITNGLPYDFEPGVLPVVNLSSKSVGKGLPVALPDNPAIGRVAAEHLFQDCGLRELAVFTTADPVRVGSHERVAGFLEAAASLGAATHFFDRGPRTQTDWTLEAQIEDLCDWIAEMPKPVGIYATDDDHAARLYNACKKIDAVIPNDVAVVGTGNDPFIGELLTPTLSSVQWSMENVGVNAAMLLDVLMSGGTPEDMTRWVPPRGVVVRRSSSVLRASDPEVQRAVVYMHEHLVDIRSINDVAEHCRMSRRTLYRRFLEDTGQNPGEVLRRLRVAYAKRMLVGTDKSFAQIADEAGYSSRSQLSRAVMALTGKSPSQLRSGV